MNESSLNNASRMGSVSCDLGVVVVGDAAGDADDVVVELAFVLALVFVFVGTVHPCVPTRKDRTTPSWISILECLLIANIVFFIRAIVTSLDHSSNEYSHGLRRVFPQIFRVVALLTDR